MRNIKKIMFETSSGTFGIFFIDNGKSKDNFFKDFIKGTVEIKKECIDMIENKEINIDFFIYQTKKIIEQMKIIDEFYSNEDKLKVYRILISNYELLKKYNIKNLLKVKYYTN